MRIKKKKGKEVSNQREGREGGKVGEKEGAKMHSKECLHISKKHSWLF